MRRSRGFTLVELLVVIAIITVLISILMPVLAMVRRQAQQIGCASNMRQIAIACLAYASESRGVLPMTIQAEEVNKNPNWATHPSQAIYMVDFSTLDWTQGALWYYIPGGADTRKRLFNCPSEGTEPHAVHGMIDGTRVVTGYANFDYEFNGFMPGGIQMSRIHHAENKMLLMEPWQPGILSGEPVTGNWMVWTDPNASFAMSMLTDRHSGKANTAFMDGHEELLDPSLFVGTNFTGGGGTLANDALYHYYDLFSDK
ncbi:MAG TPA: prepilin-type N-terminal cleavage/methylation domain-containing protein [Tepidisphaeraceae bacterium]|nr:prepilin-type N-terminal cleavage/methylation domain-containing protein [Tepidisphaeraceae bacterium]